MILYECATNSLHCDQCGHQQELPGSVYGNPEKIFDFEERFAAFHKCKPIPPKPTRRHPIRSKRRVTPDARAVAMHVLGIKRLAAA